MALTQISTQGIKDGTITGSDLATNVDLVDNQKLRLGTGNDLQIYHDGSNSYIDDTGTGDLNISGSIVRLQDSNRLTYCRGVQGGAFEIYFNNALKFDTTSSGVQIAGKINFTGTGQAIDLIDNQQIRLGTGDDLQIYHDGSNSYVSDSGTGDLRLSGNVVKLNNSGNTETMLKATENGAVELYYDNSKKLETTSGGALVTGNFYLNDNGELTLGTGGDFKIFHTGTASKINNSTGSLLIQSDVTSFHGDGGSETMASFTKNGAVELYHDNSKKFETLSTGVTITGRLNMTEGIDIPDGGDNNTSLSIGSGNDLRLYHDGSNSYIKDRGTGNLYIRGDDTLFIQSASGEDKLKATTNGSIELYYDNAKKFETTSTGVTVLGTALVGTNVELNSDAYIKVGASYDLQIYHVSNHSSIENFTGELRIKNTSGSDMVLNSTGRVQLQVANGEKAVYCDNNGAVELYYNNSKVLQTHDASGYSGIDVLGDEGGHAVINLKADEGDDGADCWQWTAQTNGASYIKNLSNGSTYEYNVKMIGGGAVELYYDAVKKFETTSAGVSVTGSISSSGNISLVDTGALQLGTSNDFTLTHNGTNSVIDNNTGDLIIRGDADDVKILAEDDIVLRDNDDSTNFIHCINGGSVILYDDGTEMFRTDNHGVTVQKELRIQGSASSGTTHFNYLDSGSNYITQNDSSTTYFRNASGTNRTKILGNGNWIWEDNYKIMLGSSQDLQIYHNGSNSYIDNEVGSFYIRDTGGAEKVRINGYGTAITGGLLFGTDTAAANALDDYEEGSLNWELAKSSTPSLGTDNGSNVKYVKVGRLVHISGRIRTDSCGSAGGDNFVFQSGSTLPFTPENAGTCVVGHWRSQDQTDKSLTASIAWLGGSTTMYLYTIDSKADYQATQNNVPADSQTNLVITFSLTYRANS